MIFLSILTACFSFSSRSFFNLSLISRSLTTHAAASPAAFSGLDLFFKRSGFMVNNGGDNGKQKNTTHNPEGPQH